MSYDVSTAIEVSDTHDIEVIHPKTGEPMMAPGDVVKDPGTGEEKAGPGKPMSVTVYSPGTKIYRAAMAASQKKFGETIVRGKSKETEEQAGNRLSRLFATCTVSFNNFDYGGMESGFEMFRACYLDPKMGWLFDLLNGELNDWGNALKEAPSS